MPVAVFSGNSSHLVHNIFLSLRHGGKMPSIALFVEHLPLAYVFPGNIGNTTETSLLDLADQSSLSLAIHAEIGKRLLNSNSD